MKNQTPKTGNPALTWGIVLVVAIALVLLFTGLPKFKASPERKNRPVVTPSKQEPSGVRHPMSDKTQQLATAPTGVVVMDIPITIGGVGNEVVARSSIGTNRPTGITVVK